MRIDGPQVTSSLSLNGTTITDLNVFVTTGSLNGITGSYATTGSNLFKGYLIYTIFFDKQNINLIIGHSPQKACNANSKIIHKFSKIINDDGTMNHLAHKYAGMDRFDCRKACVKDLQVKRIITSKIEHHGSSSRRRSPCVVPRCASRRPSPRVMVTFNLITRVDPGLPTRTPYQ